MNIDTLKQLDLRKLDSATKYPSIPTLHEIGNRGRLTDNTLVNFDGEEVIVTEKIDGCSVRLLVGDGWYIIGSRKEFLTFSEDLIYNKAMDIVESLWHAAKKLKPTAYLTVFYGELYGGTVGKSWKQYTDNRDCFGFRLFDVIEFGEGVVSYLHNTSLEVIASNRDRGGQLFVNEGDLQTIVAPYGKGIPLTPRLETSLPESRSHEAILDWLKTCIPNTKAYVGTSTAGKAEGVVIRTANRYRIAKIRFEDYKRTLRSK